MASNLTGFIAAPHTPMRADGEVDLDRIQRQAELLAHNGVRGAFVLGSTGEGVSLTIPERQAVAQRWVDVAGDDLAVIVHVTHTCVKDARELAVHAAGIGATAFAAMGPIYFRPATPEALAESCAQVASAAPDLPFYYYHIPPISGISLPMYAFCEAAVDRVPNLAGMKYTHEDLMDFGQCLTFDGGRYTMLFGNDEMLLGALAIGARGAVGSTYNWAAPLYVELLAAFEAGDMNAARALQDKSRRMIAVMKKFGGLVTGKACMALIGLDCGPVRSPLRPLSDEQHQAMRAEMEATGFFEFCSKVP